MSSIALLLSFAKRSLAQSSSTALEGWQLDDNTRSSWDILWTNLSTILACTWTALHLSVPRRNESEGDQLANKALAWIVAILAPELMTASAAEEFSRARSIAARCNAAFDAIDNEKTESSESAKSNDEAKLNERTEAGDNVGSEKNKELEEKVESEAKPELGKPFPPDSLSAKFTKEDWKAIHGFCLNMNGVLLQTKDDWTYPVHPGNVVPLIKARVIKQSHLKVREIKDRAKADSFAKAFTLLQSFWVACNIIARRAYDLPISPLEISTVAYIACAVVAYSMLWHKPKDMATPITIHLQHDRYCDYMQCQLKDIFNGNDENWIRRDDMAEDTGSAVWEAIVWLFRILTWFVTPQGWRFIRRLVNGWRLAAKEQRSAGNHQHDPNDEENTEQVQPSKEVQQTTNKTDDYDEYFTIMGSFKLGCFDLFITLLFTGIHVAAYVMPLSHNLLLGEFNS
ncbi:hypothetical protein N7510_004282 [Penicillium lagena]|uniref:uncharacterized protein n=1 Tax=Penicillium lagena TaxID=94218 RepID=UPI00253F6D25|nr:uncharacterized protein N7510_004282 [Penicillium lagena]KAJ5620298.1 hypothetical protein N7510_004282 [Penicillium lagena]